MPDFVLVRQTISNNDGGWLMNISRWSKSDLRRYLGVPCQKCSAPILFALDRSEGEAEPTRARRLILTCNEPGCRHQADYSSAKVSSYQGKQEEKISQEQE